MSKLETLVQRGQSKTKVSKSDSALVNAAQMPSHDALTANGAVTHSTSGSKCVDLFSIGAAMRNKSSHEILDIFQAAWNENPNIALKILFWIRDARGGAGERRFFSICWNWLTQNHTEEVDHLIPYIPEYGYWPDVWRATSDKLDDEVIALVRHELKNGNGLLAKWLPRKGPFAAFFRNNLNLSPKEYRKLIVSLSKTVETQMCANEWKDINYSHVPSLAMRNYRKAFKKHDQERYSDFINAALKGEAKINSSVLYPHDILTRMSNASGFYSLEYLYDDTLEAQWRQLPDFVKEGSFLPMCDVSGSMNKIVADKVNALHVSIALGLYLSERNKSVFKDAILTFSNKPQLHIVKGKTLAARANNLSKAHWEMNTNLQAAFGLILDTAIRHGLSQEDIPDNILVLSDMEFDRCSAKKTNLESIRTSFANANYKMPNIVFWNLNGRKENVPAGANEQGIVLVSGFSPSIMTQLLSNGQVTPESIMLQTVLSERYEKISLVK